MRPPGGAPALGGIDFQGSLAAHPLHGDPEPEEEDGGHAENEEEEPHLDAGSRKHDQIGAHNGGDGAACADGRHGAVPIEVDVSSVGCQSAEQIKDQEPRAPDGGFDVIGKDPQEDHIADQVSPAAVQEHAGEQGEQVLAPDCLSRHRTELPHQRIGKLELVQEYRYIQSNKSIAEGREVAAFDLVVTNGKKHVRVLALEKL